MRRAQPTVAGFEHEGRGYEPRAAGRASLEAGKGTETGSSPEPPGGMQPCRHLGVSRVRLVVDF